MRTPKPPIGFVPVDSEEASKIEDNAFVNTAFVDAGNRWILSGAVMEDVRATHPVLHYHVQLPPAVEWEEVWGWKRGENNTYMLTKNKDFAQFLDGMRFTWQEVDTIVRALNEMEGRDG